MSMIRSSELWHSHCSVATVRLCLTMHSPILPALAPMCSLAATQSSQAVDGNHMLGSQPASASASASAPAAAAATGPSGSKEYVLRSTLPADWLARFVDAPPSHSHPHPRSHSPMYPSGNSMAVNSALVLTVCAIIKCAGGRITQGEKRGRGMMGEERRGM